MSARALEHLRNAKGRQRKTMTEAAIDALTVWQETGDPERAMQGLARAMRDCNADEAKRTRMRDEQIAGTEVKA